MIKHITERLKAYEPRRLHTPFDKAGILLAITREDEPRIVLTRRSDQLRTHGGQVAFPGGRKEEQDASLLTTALRESFEEIALPPDQVEILGTLSEVVSRYKIVVTPFVGIVPPDIKLNPDPSEIESIFTVPLRFFLDTEPERYDDLGFQQYRLNVPCWKYGDYEIWGMSAVVLMDFFKVVFDRPFGRVNIATASTVEWQAPEN